MTREEQFIQLLDTRPIVVPAPSNKRPTSPIAGLPDHTRLENTGLKPVTCNALWEYEGIKTLGELRRYVADYGAKELCTIPGLGKDGVQHIYQVTGAAHD